MKIDVTKCEFYCADYDGCYCFNSSEEVYAINPNEHNSCEGNENCYFKQLQRLKHENDELKKKIKESANAAFEDCKYRFKGESCQECSLDCAHKNRTVKESKS